MSAGTRNSTKRNTQENAAQVASLLAEQWPDAYVELDYRNAFELLVATILAAQSTDKMINTITPALFAKYPDVHALAAADPSEVEPMIFKSGFYRNKAKSLIGMAQGVEERFGGKIPVDLDDLASLPGVGRKTGNVVRSVWFGEPGLPVDTHVTRLSARLKLTNETDAVKIEHDLGGIVPPAEWGLLSLRLIEHGRQVCDARRPRCDACVLAGFCPSAGKFPPPKAKR